MQLTSISTQSPLAPSRRSALLGALVAMTVLWLAAPQSSAALQDKKPRDVSQFNLGKNALALEGYDPVTYFEAGATKPKKGDAKFETLYDGVRYRFVSDANKTAFLANPGKYEPAYGGWCAYAMAKKDKVEVDVESFVVRDGRLFLFYQGLFNDTRAKWSKDPATLVKQADEKWAELIAPPKPKEG